jgi:SAM-dependent methyltransferase
MWGSDVHDAARRFVAQHVAGRRFGHVVEVGGRDVNGSVRGMFAAASYTAVDLEPGPGVDVVADCRTWAPDEPADLVLCLEVLEHADDPAGVVGACVSYLAPGGLLVVTCAGPGRTPHSGHHGGPLEDGEYYANVDPDDLDAWLGDLTDVQVHYAAGPCDVYATGRLA